HTSQEACKHPGYTENIWQPHPESILLKPDLSTLSPDTTIAILGSGLTMVDATMSLITRHFRGQIIALSRHGCLPEPHLEKVCSFPPFLDPKKVPLDVLSLLKIVLREVKEAHQKGIDWRPVFDSMRPVTTQIWQQLPLKEKRRLMRHLFNLW